VRRRLHGRATQVQRDLARMEGPELAHRARSGVMKAKRHGPRLRDAPGCVPRVPAGGRPRSGGRPAGGRRVPGTSVKRVAMTPDEMYAHVLQTADNEGRLPTSRITGRNVFPFERDGLRVVSPAPPGWEPASNVAWATRVRGGHGNAHLARAPFARPARFPRLRGTCMAIWDDLLPAVPAEYQAADADSAARALAASYDGAASKPRMRRRRYRSSRTVEPCTGLTSEGDRSVWALASRACPAAGRCSSEPSRSLSSRLVRPSPW
jgi:hypothetical protein